LQIGGNSKKNQFSQFVVEKN